VVKRSPGISTTDLVGRMLLCTKTHFIHSLQKMLAGQEGYGSPDERRAQGEAMLARLRLYATDETAKAPGAEVWFWTPSPGTPTDAVAGDENGGSFERLLAGKGPLPGQRVVYVDGGYDLFSSGHIEFLRRVGVAEEELARGAGWFDEAAVARRKVSNGGKDYGPAFVVVGVHEDEVKRVVQSRRGEGKYVQEEVRNQADLVWYIINAVDGRVFVCGSSKGMGEGVEEALIDVAMAKGNLEREEAGNFWQLKKEAGQYIAETW